MPNLLPAALKSAFALPSLAGGILAGALFAAPAAAQTAKQNFTLVNRTGYELAELYVSPGKSDAWGRDILGKSTIGDGESADVTFSNAATGCIWDLKVVYTDDGSSAYWRGIDLCRISTITIRYNRGSDTTSATFD